MRPKPSVWQRGLSTGTAHMTFHRHAAKSASVPPASRESPGSAVALEADPSTPAKRRVRVRHWLDLLSATVMAVATVATAWSAYQSSLWNSEQADHHADSTAAVVRVAKLSNLAMQRASTHVTLFVHWASAVNQGDRRMADFLFVRFPEPLKTAAGAWRAMSPLTNPEAPPSPFDMPQYGLPERIEADEWERIAQRESTAAEHANDMASRYLLLTIIYASVLFFAGISGKFRWQVLDVTVLVLGALTLLTGVTIMVASPRL